MKDTAQFEVWSLMEGSGAFDDLIFQPGKQVLLAGDGYDVLNLPGVYANSEFEANEVPRSLSIGNGIYIVHDLGLGLAEVIDQAGNVAITQGIEALMLAGETALHLQTVAMDLDESHIAVMGTPWLDRFDLTPYVHAGATQALWDEWESILRWLDDTGAELDVMQVQNTLSQDGTYTLELTDMDNDAILLESIEQITGPGGIVLFNFDPESGLLSSTLMV